VRAASLALRALNIELAQVKDVVSEKKIGEMRMQFWRDAIDLAFKNTPPQHPVAEQLTQAVHRHKLSKHWLTRLVDAREKELGVSAYLSTSDLEENGERTSSSLLYLTLQTLGVENVSSDHAASHVGKAEAIVTLLRAVPYHRSRRVVLLPMDIITRHGASQEDFLRGNVVQAVKDATFDLASLANTHLLKARSMKSQLPKASLKALLPATVCDSFLTKIQRVEFNPFHPTLAHRDPLLAYKLLWKTTFRKAF
jgi:NADH dehydrogenase [ubiquinone] 1 alpha subcomplex assembly factor 6